LQGFLRGGNERRSKFGRQTTEAVRDENSVLFRHSQRKEFEALRDEVQAARTGAHALPAVRVAGSEPDIAEQIRKLAELHAAGALTDAEFAAKKTELLSRV
jgi:hypothetical protein